MLQCQRLSECSIDDDLENGIVEAYKSIHDFAIKSLARNFWVPLSHNKNHSQLHANPTFMFQISGNNCRDHPATLFMTSGHKIRKAK